MKRAPALGLSIALVLLGAGSANAAYQRPGRVERVNVAHDGTPATQFSQYPAITPDGRFVAFASESALVPEDTNEAADVYVRDRVLGLTERVSVSTEGEEGTNAYSSAPAISDDGRIVAFVSSATNLVPGLTRQEAHVYVRDRQAGTTELISVAPDGTPGNDGSSGPSVSADGRYVAFDGFASNLVPDDMNQCSLGANVLSCVDVFVRDRATGTTTMVSRSSEGAPGNGWSSSPDISADGRYVAFHSESDNLVTPDTNRERDVFVHDRATGRLEHVSVSSDGRPGNDRSVNASISADGSVIAFESAASNLVPRDTNGVQIWVGTGPLPPTDIFIRDRAAQRTERVVAASGAEPTDWSILPAISEDGRVVAFHSMAPNLVPGDTNETMDIFAYDRVAAAVDRVSVADDGTEGNHWSAWGAPDLTADGREVVFATDAWNLVPGSEEGGRELLVRDRGPALGVGAASVAGGVLSGWATFSGRLIRTASDPAGDGHALASHLGAQVVGGAVLHRPEQGDLLLRVDVDGMAAARPLTPYPAGGGVPGWNGIPLIRYQASFRAGGASWEARAVRALDATDPVSPTLTLHRCDPACEQVGVIPGSFGNTGESVVFAIPLGAIAMEAGGSLSDVVLATAVANRGGSVIEVLDDVALGGVEIGAPSLRVAIAPRGSEPGPGDPVAISDGRFEVPFTLAEGEEAWLTACAGQSCSGFGPIG